MDLKRKAAQVKNHLKNHVVAYACGAGAVALAASGNIKAESYIGPDGHEGIRVTEGKAHVAGALALGSVASVALFMGALRKFNEDVKKKDNAAQIARMKMMEKSNG